MHYLYTAINATKCKKKVDVRRIYDKFKKKLNSCDTITFMTFMRQMCHTYMLLKFLAMNLKLQLRNMHLKFK